MLSEGLAALETNIQLADGNEEDEVKKFSVQVTEDCPKANKRIAECQALLDTGFLGDPDASNEKVLKFLNQVLIDFERVKTRTVRIQEYQTILKLPIDDFEALDPVSADLRLKSEYIYYTHLMLFCIVYCLVVPCLVFSLPVMTNFVFTCLVFPFLSLLINYPIPILFLDYCILCLSRCQPYSRSIFSSHLLHPFFSPLSPLFSPSFSPLSVLSS